MDSDPIITPVTNIIENEDRFFRHQENEDEEKEQHENDKAKDLVLRFQKLMQLLFSMKKLNSQEKIELQKSIFSYLIQGKLSKLALQKLGFSYLPIPIFKKLFENFLKLESEEKKMFQATPSNDHKEISQKLF